MSLYKDASLVMIPSAYKDGRLYSIRPVPEYGAELVTNGGFDTDSDWNKNSNWTISGGTANCDGTNSNDLNQAQNIGVIGKSYKITFTITAISQGSIAVRIGSGATAYYTSVGTHSEIVTATTTDRIRVSVLGSAIASIDNVSVKEVLVNGDFTFSRGSNLAATRVDVNGLIEKGRENLLLQSNQFGTTWVKGGTTLTSGQSGYDGTNNAWLLSKGAASYTRITQDIAKTGVHSVSVYAKANTLNKATIYIFAAGDDPFAIFNLVDGSVVSSGSIIGSNATSVGNDWWRLSITFNATTQSINFYPDFSESTAGSIFIQSAQLEQGLVATDYIETGTSAAQSGILEDMPRLDYSASCPSLLLEPQRSNLVTQSEYLGGWSLNTAGISSIQPNNAVSPEGLQNAYKVNFVVQSDSDLALAQTHSITGGSTYTYSIYIKGEGSNIGKDVVVKSKRIGGGDSAGTTTTQTLTNEWKRIDFATTYAANNINGRLLISSNDATSCLVYGAQAELGSYPTSYIPTYGTSQTRSKDNMGTTFSSALTSGGEVSVLFDIDGAYNSDLNSTGDNLAFIFSDDDRIIYNQNANGYHRIEMNVEGRTEFIYRVTSVDRVDRAKICIVVTASTYAMYVNGSLEDSGSFTGTGNWTSADSFSNSMTDAIAVVPMQQLLYFPTALTSSEAIALTTL